MLFPPRFYFPGLGILLGIALIFAVGLLAKPWLFRRLFDWWSTILNRIPLVKTVYGAVQDFMEFLSGDLSSRFNRCRAGGVRAARNETDGLCYA